MPDRITKKQRSALMQKIKSKDTLPELVVRKSLHRHGLRFRLHRNDLPGRPDIVMPRHNLVVQVRGCFWHGHRCPVGHKPKSRLSYWLPKIRATKRRDRRTDRLLAEGGWKVFVIWECQCRDTKVFEREIRKIVRWCRRNNA